MTSLNLQVGGHPFKIDDITHLQAGLKEAVAQLAIQIKSGVDTPYILWGCTLSNPAIGQFNTTAGAIYYSGEIYMVDAGNITGVVSDSYADVDWLIQETFVAPSPVTYQDASVNNVHSVKKLILTDSTLVPGTPALSPATSISAISNVISTDDVSGPAIPWVDTNGFGVNGGTLTDTIQALIDAIDAIMVVAPVFANTASFESSNVAGYSTSLVNGLTNANLSGYTPANAYANFASGGLTWTVPVGVSQIQIELFAGGGGWRNNDQLEYEGSAAAVVWDGAASYNYIIAYQGGEDEYNLVTPPQAGDTATLGAIIGGIGGVANSPGAYGTFTTTHPDSANGSSGSYAANGLAGGNADGVAVPGAGGLGGAGGAGGAGGHPSCGSGKIGENGLTGANGSTVTTGGDGGDAGQSGAGGGAYGKEILSVTAGDIVRMYAYFDVGASGQNSKVIISY
jgi:hypothetical protein